tara:strand:+ start:113 stop:511 length:399 start_codon:yes stop_codon:yes gene_type:complete
MNENVDDKEYHDLMDESQVSGTESAAIDVEHMKDKDYVVVTAISSYRMRYVMHRDDLQTLALNGPVSIIDRANDTVTMEECEEFSQAHMGEYIVDTVEMDEADMLALFDKDNDYLREWSNDQKVAVVRKSIS